MITELLKALEAAKTRYFAFYTTQYGVPLVGEGGYMQQFSQGLDRLHEAGWELVALEGTIIVLRRRMIGREGW
jgi:hypothetical protein